MRKIFCWLTCLSFLSSCVSVTTFKTQDPEAKIFAGSSAESAVGELSYSDRQWIFGSVDVRVEKTGCPTRHYRVYRSDDFSPEGFILGLFSLGLGFLWAGRYLSAYDLNYQCGTEVSR